MEPQGRKQFLQVHWLPGDIVQYKTLMPGILTLREHREDQGIPGVPSWGSCHELVQVRDHLCRTELTRLRQKKYSIPMHLPPMSHTGHFSNVASGGASSHSTFESDAEAQSQGVTPPVTPPTAPPNSRDGKKSHWHCSPKGKVILEKKDEANHKDEATCKESDSTSSKKSHGGKGGKYGSSKDGAASPLKHTQDTTLRKWKEPQLEAPPGPTSTQSRMPSPQKDVTNMDEQPSFLSPPVVTSTPHKIRGECQHSMSIDSIPSKTSFDPQLYPSFSYIGPMGTGSGSMPTLSLSGSQCVTSSGFCPPKDKSSHLPPIRHLSQDQVAEIYQLVTECHEIHAEVAQKF